MDELHTAKPSIYVFSPLSFNKNGQGFTGHAQLSLVISLLQISTNYICIMLPSLGVSDFSVLINLT